MTAPSSKSAGSGTLAPASRSGGHPLDGRSSRPRRRCRQSGFTLLEILVTAVLTATVLAGIWSLLKMYGDLYETGFAKTTRAQLLRSLVEQLSDDLASTVVPPQRPEPTTSGRRAPRSASNEQDNLPGPTLPPEDGSAEQPSGAPVQFLICPVHGPFLCPTRVGLVGTSQWLRLDVLQAEPPLAPSPETTTLLEEGSWEEVTPRSTALVTVVYSFQDSQLFAEAESARPGLTRQVIRMGASSRPAETSLSPSAALAEAYGQSEDSSGEDLTATGGPEDAAERSPLDDLARPGVEETYLPEVVAFQLRYFDGQQWTSRWDSQASGKLPVAVEVALQLAQPGQEADRDEGGEDNAALQEPDPSEDLPADLNTTTEQTDLFDTTNPFPPSEAVYRFVFRLDQTPHPLVLRQTPSFAPAAEVASAAGGGGDSHRFNPAERFSTLPDEPTPPTSPFPECTCVPLLESGL